MLLLIVPTAGPVLAIVGFILTLIAVKYISDVLGDGKIFTNMLIAVILAIAGIIALAVVVLGAVFSMFGMGYLTGGMTSLSPNLHALPNGVPPANFISLILDILVGLVVAWVIYIVSAIFLRRSLSSIGKGLNVGLFGTAGLLYLIGAALTVILVGLVLIFVAEILMVVAFFSIPDQPPQQPTAPMMYTPPPPPPPSASPS